MIKIINKISSFLILTFLIFTPITAYMAGDYGLNETVGYSEKTKALTINSNLETSISKLIGYALSFVGTIFFLLIIWGGFKWMTSAGNDKDVSAAKELITNSVIGLIIILAAYMIVAFIGKTLTS